MVRCLEKYSFIFLKSNKCFISEKATNKVLQAIATNFILKVTMG